VFTTPQVPKTERQRAAQLQGGGVLPHAMSSSTMLRSLQVPAAHSSSTPAARHAGKRREPRRNCPALINNAPSVNAP